MKPIIYLKKDYYGTLNFICIDKNKLSAIEVFRDESLDITKHGDLEDLEIHLKTLLSGGFVPSDRESFNTAFIGFANNVNDLSKEL